MSNPKLNKWLVNSTTAQAYKDGIEKGRTDREREIIDCINHYTKMLVDALNNKEENPILHEALASQRADEIRVRKLVIEQIKKQKNE